MNDQEPAVEWLLQSDDASVRYFALTDLLNVSPRSRLAQAARKEIPNGRRVRALLAGQGPGKPRSHPFALHPGGFGVHPYKKWHGAHWRLVSLVELGIPGDNPQARAAADQVLTWLTSEEHQSRIRTLRERTRRCGSQEGNALAVCSRLGLCRDPRVQYLARSLVEWQWPDGGWNCDKRPAAHHSSFYESLATLWGLTEYHRVTGDKDAEKAAGRAAEFFLQHHLFRSEKTGAIIDPAWLKLHYPLYWHYDILQALVILMRAGRVLDPRAREAVDLVESKRLADGRWRVERCYWNPPGQRTSNLEVVDWGRSGPNEMITLNALRVLKAAGRLRDG